MIRQTEKSITKEIALEVNRQMKGLDITSRQRVAVESLKVLIKAFRAGIEINFSNIKNTVEDSREALDL